MPNEEMWVRIPIDYRHTHYKCGKCGEIQRYRRTPYCPMCGQKMANDCVLTEKGKVIWRYSKCAT